MGMGTLYKGYDDSRVLRDLLSAKALKCGKNWPNTGEISASKLELYRKRAQRYVKKV